MGCDHLTTEAPTCGSGENGLPDDLLLDSHFNAVNNDIKSDDDNGFVWFAVVFYFAAMLALLEGYPTLTQRTAHGQANVYNVYWPIENTTTSSLSDPVESSSDAEGAGSEG